MYIYYEYNFTFILISFLDMIYSMMKTWKSRHWATAMPHIGIIYEFTGDIYGIIVQLWEAKDAFADLEVWDKQRSVNIFRGGASDEQDIFQMGIENARRHGIIVLADKPNKAEGDCLFESVIDNINHRACFSDKLNEPVQHYREKWVSEMQQEFQKTDHFPGKEDIVRWNSAWDRQKKSNEYNVNDYNISDIVPAGLGHCVKKNILVFNVDKTSAWPVQIFAANHFHINIQPISDKPVLLVYNGGHYESLLPKSDGDAENCRILVKALQNQTYEKLNPKGYLKSNNNTNKRKRKISDSLIEQVNQGKKSKKDQDSSTGTTTSNEKEYCNVLSTLKTKIFFFTQ
jgi:hypothetical protein